MQNGIDDMPITTPRQFPFAEIFTLAASLLAALSFSSSTAHAKKFLNQFLEFELPIQWDCTLEGAEWVCQSINEQKKRDAIVVLAAKLKGDQDSLDKYQEYLNKPRAFTSPGGKAVTSQAKYVKTSVLNSQSWVDALHLESEIPGFYTRYLATVKEDIGVLVTYSISKGKFIEYQPQFEEMVKSMRVFRKAGGAINAGAGGSIFDQTKLPGTFTQANVFPDSQASPAADETKKPAPKKDDDNFLLFAVLGVLAVGFIIYKKRQNS